MLVGERIGGGSGADRVAVLPVRAAPVGHVLGVRIGAAARCAAGTGVVGVGVVGPPGVAAIEIVATQIPHPASTAGKLLAELTELGRVGLDPANVAAQVLTAIRENELYVFTHHGADWRAELEERFAAILAAMDKAAARQAL